MTSPTPRERLKALGIRLDRLETRLRGRGPEVLLTVAGTVIGYRRVLGTSSFEIDGREPHSDKSLAAAAGIAPNRVFALRNELFEIQLDLVEAMWERIRPVAEAAVRELNDGLDTGETG